MGDYIHMYMYVGTSHNMPPTHKEHTYMCIRMYVVLHVCIYILHMYTCGCV